MDPRSSLGGLPGLRTGGRIHRGNRQRDGAPAGHLRPGGRHDPTGHGAGLQSLLSGGQIGAGRGLCPGGYVDGPPGAGHAAAGGGCRCRPACRDAPSGRDRAGDLSNLAQKGAAWDGGRAHDPVRCRFVVGPDLIRRLRGWRPPSRVSHGSRTGWRHGRDAYLAPVRDLPRRSASGWRSRYWARIRRDRAACDSSRSVR